MFKCITRLFINALYLTSMLIGSLAAASLLEFRTSVPFQEKWIAPHQTLVVEYNNVDHWDTIVCGCDSQQQCASYVATWKYKGARMQSIGPNYLSWLELYLGLPPESPPQNADQQGLIKIYNTGNKPIPLRCDFTV